MLADKPDVVEYGNLLDKAVDLRDDLTKLEYLLEKKIALCIKEAMANKAKTREIDVIKVVGNSVQDEEELGDLRNKIASRKHDIGHVYTKIRVWQARQETYRSDSYHQVRGSIPFGSKEESE